MSEHEAEEVVPTGDDNLLTRHKHIAESIEMIRNKKNQLLKTLRGLSEAENPDKALMAKLVDAFDMMTAQETAFLGVLKNIVDIHEQATEDVAAESEALRTNGDIGAQDSTKDAGSHEEGSEDAKEDNAADEEMIKETLKELEQVSLQALAAAQLNEKLVETLQRTKKNRSSVLELRKNKTEELKTAATAAMAEVKKAKQEVTANRTEIQKKAREAEELRKAALKAGIQVGAEEEKHNEQIAAALAAVVNDVERIPPIPVVEEPKVESEAEDPLEVRRKEIRENIRKEKERREHVNQTIREKLAAMEARKQRMKEIRRLISENHGTSASSIVEVTKKKLEESLSHVEASNGDSQSDSKENGIADPSTPHVSLEDEQTLEGEEEAAAEDEQTRRDIEETFHSAELNLQNLTLLRQRLEKIQAQGESGLTQEDEELISQFDAVAEKINERVDLESDEEEESVVDGKISSSDGDVPYVSNSPSLDDCPDRLRNIEQLIQHQTDMLTELLRLNQPSNSRRASVVHSCSSSSSDGLLKLLCSTSPALLRGLSACLLQLADGRPSPPHLRRILDAILEVRYGSNTEYEPPEENDGNEQQQMPPDLDKVVAGVMLSMQSILEQSEEVDEDTEQRLCDCVVLNAAIAYPNVPRSLIETQLGPLVADTLATFSNEMIVDVADELSAEIVRLLHSELGFFHLINSLNCIPNISNTPP
ncbi:hypothetical protein Q1695_015172 [Nippostrongylus brasiliensis]|nr:hypothetical protein Q1695_015172 [Nippostrongylus brasiliensis]